MLNRNMIEDHIQHDFDTIIFGGCHQAFKIIHCSKHWIDRCIVSDIIAIVILWARIDWT